MFFLREKWAARVFISTFLLCAMVPVAVSSAAAQVAVDPAAAVAGIDTDVQQAMDKLHVPGVAVGVIVDGKVIFAKGYGVREIGKPEPVDANTIFDIGSMTKSFTATVVAAMVDDGKLQFDKPVIQYLPWFKMYDPIATQLITPRDLLIHDSGLPGHDFIRISTYMTREELVHRIRYLEPNVTFRQKWQYNNLMYVVAGYLAGSVAGTTWEDLVKQRIFVPLGMTRSNTSAGALQQSNNYAHPHLYVDGKIVTIPVYDYQKFGIGPNGAINSCIDDMLKYLAFHLSDGTVDGKLILSKMQMQQLHQPFIPYLDGRVEYALGWGVYYHSGHKVVGHSGSINGFTSDMALLPDKKTGIVVLTNSSESRLPVAIRNDLLDRLLNLQPQDYLGQMLANITKSEGSNAALKARIEAARIPNTKPTLDLSAYTGAYFHPAYGTIQVDRDGDHLIARFDAINLSLKHYHYDTFEYVVDAVPGAVEDGPPSLAQFHIGTNGRVMEILLPLEPAVNPFVFTKVK